jgi:hypothetical protein
VLALIRLRIRAGTHRSDSAAKLTNAERDHV